jgi:hypothetical protein
MLISLDEFNRLPHFEQEELIRERATSLYASQAFGEYDIHYFGLFSFVVEAYVFTETGKIARFKAIPSDQSPASFRLK